MFKLFYILLFPLILVDASFYKNSQFFKKISVYDQFIDIWKSKTLKEPFILDGIKSPLKKDFCRIFCDITDIKFKEYNFHSFLLKKPYLKYDNSFIYVNDYLVGDGRILSYYEQYSLISIPKTTNLIILETDDLKNIPYKDMYLNKKFPIIEFPHISKKQLLKYIDNVILNEKYNDDLLLLNWINYNIQFLNFEKINLLLFELNNMIFNNISIEDIHKNINNIIDNLR